MGDERSNIKGGKPNPSNIQCWLNGETLTEDRNFPKRCSGKARSRCICKVASECFECAIIKWIHEGNVTPLSKDTSLSHCWFAVSVAHTADSATRELGSRNAARSGALNGQSYGTVSRRLLFHFATSCEFACACFAVF